MNDLVESRIDKVLTQYRESPKLLFMLRTYLALIADLIDISEGMATHFELDSAVGEQLTYIGNEMGWPREHCVCTPPPVFGLTSGDCAANPLILGFCEVGGSWQNCVTAELGSLRVDDDELYRQMLYVRAYALDRRFDRAALDLCVAILWGEAAQILYDQNGKIVIAIGRELSASESVYLPLYTKVLPVNAGVKVLYHRGSAKNLFGFGFGWGGFCEDTEATQALATNMNDVIATEDGLFGLGLTDSVVSWMCQFDISSCDSTF